jgi:hypothetical protein
MAGKQFQPLKLNSYLINKPYIMRASLFLLMLMAVLFSCKKDEMTTYTAIENIVGKWRLKAQEQEVNGVKAWVNVPDSTAYVVGFRFDGVILDNSGLPACCVPDRYYVNETLFKVVPKAKLDVNPVCAFSLCMANPAPWNIVQNGNELIINERKFTRE